MTSRKTPKAKKRKRAKRRARPSLPTGRPSEYVAEEHPLAARRMTGEGKTLAEVAEALGVARSTVQLWMEQHPDFSVAIKLGREDATDKVEASLFKRATGYVQPIEKLLVVSGGQGFGSSVERHATAEHIPADVTAARYWLANRRAHEWRERQEVKHEGTLTLEQVLAQSALPPASEPPAATTPTNTDPA